MDVFTGFLQLLVTIIAGVWFFSRLRAENENAKQFKNDYKDEAEKLNRLRRISLTEPITEASRPSKCTEVIGQEEGMRALKSALWGKNPQHVLIYGPPGVGKTAAARVILEEVKKSPQSPFLKNAPFVEVDAAVMRCDEYGFTDPLLGSVHDPIYQGSGSFGQNGIPRPMPGAVTRAHGGILFLDEIGELKNEQLNKLLKVLEDRRVMPQSSYYSSSNRKIPVYIKDVFENGFPADFRLIGATTESPGKIPEAIRSRCAEVYFSALPRADIVGIVRGCAMRCGIRLEDGTEEIIADYAENGRDAVKILQSAANLSKMDGGYSVTRKNTEWAVKAGRYNRRSDKYPENKIIDISFIKPQN